MAALASDLVVGVFEHRPQAEQAVAALWAAGFAHDRIDMATRGGVTQASPNLHLQKGAANAALTGALAGASAGAVAGALAVGLLVPGLGEVIGGGLIAGALGGAALGAAGGTFLGPFVAIEMGEDDAHYYAHAVDEGRTVVLVKAGERADEAREILRRHGAGEKPGA
jgi:hypothetical protein